MTCSGPTAPASSSSRPSPRTRTLNHLLFIGAYRDTETAAHHPFMLTRDAIAAAGVPIHTIHLGALDAERDQPADRRVSALRAEVHSAAGPGHPCQDQGQSLLCQSVSENPLSISTILCLDPAQGWHWDLDQILELQVTDNVVQFMADKLQLLPPTALELIRSAPASATVSIWKPWPPLRTDPRRGPVPDGHADPSRSHPAPGRTVPLSP